MKPMAFPKGSISHVEKLSQPLETVVEAPTPPSPFLSPGGASPNAVIGWEHTWAGGSILWEKMTEKATTADYVLESVTRRKRA